MLCVYYSYSLYLVTSVYMHCFLFVYLLILFCLLVTALSALPFLVIRKKCEKKNLSTWEHFL